VNIGDEVKSGQLLAELDSTEQSANVYQNEAVLAKAKSDLDYAELTLKRQNSLFKEGYTSQETIDGLKKTYISALASYKQAEANLRVSLAQLEYTKLFSPIDGVTADIKKAEREMIQSGSSGSYLIKIINLAEMEVLAYVDETDIGRIKSGDNVTFTVDTYPDFVYSGTIRTVYPEAVIQDNIVNYIAAITIVKKTNNEANLLPEMTANVTIITEKKDNILAIPTKALLNDQKSKYVLVKVGNKEERRTVTTGIKANGYIEIITGLQEGEIILVAE
jgi:RND family efflux transporter MFP subunit